MSLLRGTTMKYLRKQIYLYILTIFSFFISATLVSAYSPYSIYWLRPEYLLDSSLVRFGLVFLFFYAVIYFGAKKVFKEETAIAMVVSFVIALFASYSLWIRGFLDFYFSFNVFDWVLVIVFLIFFVLFAKFLYTSSSKFGSIFALIAMWIALFLLYTSDFFPSYALPDGLKLFFEIITGQIGIALVIIIIIFLIFKKDQKKHHQEGYHIRLHDQY